MHIHTYININIRIDATRPPSPSCVKKWYNTSRPHSVHVSFRSNCWYRLIGIGIHTHIHTSVWNGLCFEHSLWGSVCKISGKFELCYMCFEVVSISKIRRKPLSYLKCGNPKIYTTSFLLAVPWIMICCESSTCAHINAIHTHTRHDMCAGTRISILAHKKTAKHFTSGDLSICVIIFGRKASIEP